MAKGRQWMQGAAKADSKFEGKIRDVYLSDWDFQGDKVAYSITHNYTPDFVKGKYIIETKGRFREPAEARKYLYIKEVLEKEGRELIFVFSSDKTLFPFAKKRKDGTRQTQVEWAERHGFRWFTEETLPQFLEDSFKVL